MGATLPHTGFRRHLEGWQVGLVAVLLPLLTVWLTLPRPVEPAFVPLPEADRHGYARLREHEAQRARDLTQGTAGVRLDFSVRAVGEAVRRFGKGSAEGDANFAERARGDARALYRAARSRGKGAELAALRAVQTRLFLDAVARFEQSSADDRELRELGGDFAEKCRRSAWISERGKLVLSAEELFALYRVRWTELVGALDDAELRLTLSDYRVYYAALLRHGESPDPRDSDLRRLGYIGALVRRDSAYPAHFARGVVLYRLGQRAAAAAAFSTHLRAMPDGPLALYAKNYLLYALAEDPGEE